MTTAAAVTATGARDLLHLAMKAGWPDDRAAEKAIGNAIVSLGAALYNHASLTAGIHWSAIYPDLDSPEPEAEAGRIADQDVSDAAGGLRKALTDWGITS